MPLTELEKKTAAMLAAYYHKLTPLIEQLAEMELPDLNSTCMDLAAISMRGLELANLVVQLDEAIESAYDKLVAVSKAILRNDLVAVALGMPPPSWGD